MATLLGAINDIDEIKVREVILFAENDSDLYDVLNRVYVPYVKTKIKKKQYNRDKALKLLEYYYQNYVRPAMKSPKKYGYDPRLNPAERKAFSQYFRAVAEEIAGE
jgi:hypothetical protein